MTAQLPSLPAAAASSATLRVGPPPGEPAAPSSLAGLRADVESYEKKQILDALGEQCAGNQSRAAKLLGIELRRTLITKIQRLRAPPCRADATRTLTREREHEGYHRAERRDEARRSSPSSKRWPVAAPSRGRCSEWCARRGAKLAGLFGDALVFKLGGDAHASAIALEGAELFDPSGIGRAMKEWVVVPKAHAKRWPTLGERALDYVLGAGKGVPARKVPTKKGARPPPKKGTAKKAAAKKR